MPVKNASLPRAAEKARPAPLPGAFRHDAQLHAGLQQLLADAVLLCEEACPLGLAPTTSTTCQLAMGDAISLAVMEARQFTKDQYAVFHPGGALGKRLLLTVEDVMRTGDFVATVAPDTKLRDVLFAITEANAGAALVIDGKGLLAGIITDGDIRRALLSSEDNLHADARDIMSPNPVTISPEKLATEALHRMEENGRKIGEMPVIRDGRPLGVICLKDLLTVGIV